MTPNRKASKVGIDQRANHGERRAVSGTMKRGSSVRPFHSMKSGMRTAIARWMHLRVVDLERKCDEVGADAEIDRLAEAQDSGKTPDQIDAEGEDRIAKKLAEQRHHILIGAVVRIAADRGDDERAKDQGPQRDERRPPYPSGLSRRSSAHFLRPRFAQADRSLRTSNDHRRS